MISNKHPRDRSQGEKYMRLVLTLVVLALIQSAATAFALAQNIDDHRYVCMMQDSLQVKPGVPIDYGGKTYYGCCPMCAEKMKADPVRYMKSKDPVSQGIVDKATALIFGHDGKAFYFESEANRRTFANNPSRYLAGTNG